MESGLTREPIVRLPVSAASTRHAIPPLLESLDAYSMFQLCRFRFYSRARVLGQTEGDAAQGRKR